MLSDDELLEIPLPDLVALAGAKRDEAHGRRVTFSPKVFIPLTMLCRDRCGYCTFAKAPARLAAPYLSPDEVLAIARAGREAGCHEALFTLGERPELRYPQARDWLHEHGHASTVDYLAHACALVLEETGLLPHANAGALFREELAQLRPVAASQGMMLESLAEGLAAHRGAPDKDPARRLATLEAAGELAIPFTTGILVGIGDDRAAQLAGLRAIAASHARHGHVQEVIVQNFLPKAGTKMARSRPCPPDDLLWAVAVARLVLPPEVHVQAPPNLSDDLAPLLAAGIDDWGGVSPVTADHVNPERAWPALDVLRGATEAAGHVLAPRLTIYPEYALDSERWLDPALRFGVLDCSDAESLAREDPWCSGGEASPPVLVGPGAGAGAPPGVARGTSSAVREVLAGVALGQEVGEDEIVTLFSARGPEMRLVAEVADDLRRDTVGDTVTFVHNRNINYTNVCTFKCRFCAFSKGPLSLNLARRALSVGARRGDAARRRGGGGGRDRGVPPGRHPSELRRRLLPARAGGGPRRVGAHPHPRLHRARGDRGRPALGCRPGRVPDTAQGGRAQDAAGHGGRDPRRRGARRAVPRQGVDRRVARGAPHRALGRPALEHHHHVRLGGAAGELGPPHRAHTCAPARDGRLHRVRPAAVRAHGDADLPPTPITARA